MSDVLKAQVRRIAEALLEEFDIGNSSCFCDELQFDAATVEDIVSIIEMAINDKDTKQ